MYFVGWLENDYKLMTRGLNFFGLEASQGVEPHSSFSREAEYARCLQMLKVNTLI